MINKIIIILVLLTVITSTNSIDAQERKVAVTIDDLPCSHCGSAEEIAEINNKTIKALQKYEVPAIGFVNEEKLEENVNTSERINILKSWIENGFELGNHTYSHIYINDASIEEYKNDVLKGERVTRPLLKEYDKNLKYFRHTQLRTGPTDSYRKELTNFLDSKGYTIAPVTIDNDEYIYAYCYQKAKEKGDKVTMRLIAYDYIKYMDNIIKHYESVSDSLLGYQVCQTLLLHLNALNADYLEAVLNLFDRKGYEFISLDEALKDDAYKIPEITVETGLSWLNRWGIFKGKEISKQPDVSKEISNLYIGYRNGKVNYQIQKLNGEKDEINKILKNIKAFSEAYKSRNYQALAEAYTEDGKIFPDKTGVIEGRKAIQERWTLSESIKILEHIITPKEITVDGNTAYDYGYYEGQTKFKNGNVSSWQGKYVIIWKKINGDWKMYLDIWNSL